MFFVILILFLLVGGALTIVTVQNLMSPYIHVAFFTWQTPALPVGLVVLLSFLLGAILLYLVSAISAWRDRREIRRLQKQITQLEQQILPVSGYVPANPGTVQQGNAAGTPIMPMPGSPLPPQN